MPTRAIIFGTGALAEVVQFYLDRDSDYQIVGFTATDDRVTNEEFHGLPVVPFTRVEQLFPPDQHEIFVAIGYTKLN